MSRRFLTHAAVFLGVACGPWGVEHTFAQTTERAREIVGKSLANEDAFDGMQCRFVMREGIAETQEEAARGRLAETWSVIEGTWGRDDVREWLVAKPVKVTENGIKIRIWVGAHATDGEYWLKATSGVVMIESWAGRDSRPIFSGSPWSSLGFLGGARVVNNPAKYFAFQRDHPEFKSNLRIQESESQVTLLTHASEGPVTQDAKAVFDVVEGAIPLRYVHRSRRNGTQTMHFESRIIESKTLANGCVFPTSVVAYYHPSDSHPYFRVVTFDATDFAVVDPDPDPLLFTAEERFQLHNNVDDYVSAVAEGEKIYLSSLSELAQRVKEANVRRMVAKEPSGSGVIWIVVVGLVVVAIPSAWFWYVRTR